MSFLSNSCLRKLRHPDYLSAFRHATGLNDDGSLVIYLCPFCGGLHVGHWRRGTASRVRRGLRKAFGPEAV
jgi:hypothetical protein